MSPLLVFAGVGLGLWWLLTRSDRFVLKSGDRVGLIGDSLSVGLGPPLVAEMKKHGVVVDAKGKGATIAGGWRVFPEFEQVLSKKPRAVFVSLGTNDCAFEGKPCGSFAENIADIANRIRSAGAVPIMLLPPSMPWEKKADGAVRMQRVRSALQRVGAYAVTTSGLERAPDGIHMAPGGYAQWARELTEAFT